MFFNGPQSIRSRHRSMLAGIARQNQPPTAGLHHPDQLTQLLAPNLPGLIHNDDGTRWQFAALQKTGEGFGGQTVLLQVMHLLALRSKHHHGMPGSRQAAFNFLQGKTLACTRPAPKQRDKIPVAENCIHRRLLFGGEGGSRLVVGSKCGVPSLAIVSGHDDFQFPPEGFARSQLGRTFLAHVVPLADSLPKFLQFEILAPATSQRFGHEFIFVHHGTTFKQVFIRPGHHCTHIGFDLTFRSQISQTMEGFLFLRRQLFTPKRTQAFSRRILDFSPPVAMRYPFAQVIHVAGFFTLPDPIFRLHINLGFAFGKRVRTWAGTPLISKPRVLFSIS